METLTRISLARPLLMTCLLLAVSLSLASGLPRLRTEFGSRVLIGDDHPSIRTLDAFIQRFGGGVPLYIAWECGEGRPCQSVFDDRSLEMAHAVTASLAPRQGVGKVRSISNAPIFVPTDAGFAIRSFVENDTIVPDRDELARRAREDPLWMGNLISADGRVGAIIVQPIASESETDERVVGAVLEAIAPYDAFDFALVGEAFGNIIGGRELAESTGDLIPFMVIVIALVIFVQTWSWQSVLGSLLTLGVALIWTFGLLGWIGWPRDSILEILAPLLLIVGVCDALHFFSAYAGALDPTTSPGDRRGALHRAASSVASPCLLTTATTGAAFLSFATSDLDTFERFGVISAAGVLACLILTFTLLPILLWSFPADGIRTVRVSRGWRSILGSTVRTAERRSIPILVASLGVVAACAFSWSAYIRVDTSRQELFGENSRILRWVHFFETNLRPSYGIEVDLAIPKITSATAPSVLQRVEQFAMTIEKDANVGRAWSIVPIIERLNALLHNGEATFERIPSTSRANAEILEIIALEDPELVDSWMSFDRSRLRVSIDVREQNYATGARLLEDLRSHAASTFPADWRMELTGTLPLGFDWVTDVQATQLRSFPTAFVLVFILVTIFLRSARLGLAALVPALVPVVVVLGAMGITGLSLDVGRAMIAAVVIGISVDDSIHLLHRYQSIRACGEDARFAIRSALLQTGRPIVMTSLALALGFMTLTASAWGTVSSFGFFVSLSILVALVATLYILPALLIVATRRGTSP